MSRDNGDQTFSLEEIESDLLFDDLFGRETFLERLARRTLAEDWRFTVYPTQRPDEATVHAQRKQSSYLYVLKATFLQEYLAGVEPHYPVTGSAARELVARVGAGPFPWR